MEKCANIFLDGYGIEAMVFAIVSAAFERRRHGRRHTAYDAALLREDRFQAFSLGIDLYAAFHTELHFIWRKRAAAGLDRN